MYARRLLVLCGLLSNALCKPLNDTDDLQPTMQYQQDAMKTQIVTEPKTHLKSGRTSRDQSSPNNPLAGWQNLIGSGSPTSSTAGGMPPVMVLGMHQAVVVPLTALPGIFQTMMTGLFNNGNLNSQQGGTLIPGVPNVIG